MHIVLSFSSFYPNPFFLLKALPPWLSVPRFLAEIKLIFIMKVGPIHCAEVKKELKKRKTTFIRGQAGCEPQD